MASYLRFLYRQFFITPPKVDPQLTRLHGQTGIVTGANVGLGLEACQQLLNLGLGHLILAIRNKNKGNDARVSLSSQAPDAHIEVWELDMNSYDSVTAFTQRCAGLPRLDFAILNAGVLKSTQEINEQTGHEEVVQVNYLSTALLTLQLLPIMDKNNASGSQPRTVTIVGSESAEWAAFKEQTQNPIFPAFNDPKLFDTKDRYCTSKLLQVLFVTELCAVVPSSRCIVNLVNPGLCYGSVLLTEVKGALGAVFDMIKRIIGRPTSIGARTLVNAAVVQGAASHGQYLSDCAIAK